MTWCASGLRLMARWVPVSLMLMFAEACGSGGPAGPEADSDRDLFVLNSTGQTLAAFSVGDGLAAVGTPVDLGAGFDGDAMDLSATYAAATVSSFGGSRIRLVELETGLVLNATFPLPEGDLANPAAPSIDDVGTVWVGGRGSDAVYRLQPGDGLAERVAEGVGTFIERVVPVGDHLYVVDANLDDDGGTFQPLGPGRVVVLRRDGGEEAVIPLPADLFNPTDAVYTGGDLIVLAAGTFDPGTFLPEGNGALVAVRVGDGSIGTALPLQGNGISLELGADGDVYVTTTSDFESTTVLRYDPTLRLFARGPSDPILVRDGAGTQVACWAATAMEDGRLLCVTFSFAEAGRLLLTQPDGMILDEASSGFGSTDLALY